MGWGLRVGAALVGLVGLGTGFWPLTLLVAVYLALSFRKPKGQRAVILKQQVLPKQRSPWGRFAVGSILILLSGVALLDGCDYSPFVLFFGGVALLLLPQLRSSPFAAKVVPVEDSVLLRSRIFPLLWYALAEVKLESQNQVRGVASMGGRLLVFAGKNPSATRVVGVLALDHRRAEEKVVKRLRQETRMLSQRGAHLLPADSQDASRKLSLRLGRLSVGSEDLESVTSLPFDVFAMDVKEGLVVRHRAFMIEEPDGTAWIPSADLASERPPLLAELVEEIGEKHGWPSPDEYSPFLASLDASRGEPLGDRMLTKGEDGGKVRVEAPGGTQVLLSRSQLRMLARVYA